MNYYEDKQLWRYRVTSYRDKNIQLKGQNGAVKITKPANIKPAKPKQLKRSKRLPKPYRKEYADNMNHIRNIMREV